MDQPNVAGCSAQSDKESHDDELIVRLDESGSEGEKAPEDLCEWKVILCSVDMLVFDHRNLGDSG